VHVTARPSPRTAINKPLTLPGAGLIEPLLGPAGRGSITISATTIPAAPTRRIAQMGGNRVPFAAPLWC